MAFIGIVQPEEFRAITRGHILAWRVAPEKQNLAGATIRRSLATPASLYDYLCEANGVTYSLSTSMTGMMRARATQIIQEALKTMLAPHCPGAVLDAILKAAGRDPAAYMQRRSVLPPSPVDSAVRRNAQSARACGASPGPARQHEG